MSQRARDMQPFTFEALMPHLVQHVLLVASAYDSFILEEEGRFSDRLLGQYQELDLASPPSFEHVPSAKKALRQLRREDYDLVITTPHVNDMSPARLGAEIAEQHPGMPVVLLTYDRADAQSWSQMQGRGGIDNVFLWTGDPRLLLAVVKCVEDKKNVDHDTRQGLVRVIIVVEDSPAYYSSFLPIIYAELLDQIRRLLADRLNERDRNFRMRARPKILLARTWEEGRGLFRRYRENVLGIISDVRFPRRGRLDDAAGIDFIRMVRKHAPDLPVLLQSRQREHAELARSLGVVFADKNSPELLAELREFMRSSFGFGPFVFRLAEGAEVRRAETIREMLEALRDVPDESLHHHASRNHVSNWLMARGEFPLALEVRPKRVSDFATTSELRRYLVSTFTDFLEQRQRGQVTDFRGRPDPLRRDFLRLGRGSMGGKARSIAFMSHLKANHPVHERYPHLKIIVPRTAVICTDVFDRFCERGNLRERAMAADEDAEVARLFLEQPLDFELMADLASILREVRYPLAVRSSSLLEDSEFQPLAGLYRTYLLPNCSDSDDVRLEQLARAVRLVFASTFFRGPRTCLEATSMRIEEEKMAVIVQRLIGRRYGERFYPHFAGVAQSHNYYPFGHSGRRTGSSPPPSAWGTPWSGTAAASASARSTRRSCRRCRHPPTRCATRSAASGRSTSPSRTCRWGWRRRPAWSRSTSRRPRPTAPWSRSAPPTRPTTTGSTTPSTAVASAWSTSPASSSTAVSRWPRCSSTCSSWAARGWARRWRWSSRPPCRRRNSRGRWRSSSCGR